MLTVTNAISPARIALSATTPAILYNRMIVGWNQDGRSRLERGDEETDQHDDAT